MTTTYDPFDPQYLVEPDLREELTYGIAEEPIAIRMRETKVAATSRSREGSP